MTTTIPRLRAPIVLVHGLFGFDQVCLGNWVLLDYFRAVPEALRAAGNRVVLARLPPTHSIAERAARLGALLDRAAPHEPVHLIAHSMGGLDARYLISRLGMAARVLSLTTLGTPHHGSPFADWGLRRLRRLLSPVLDVLTVPYGAFDDLTVASCAAFNRQTPDAPGVRYFSVAGRFRPDWTTAYWHLPAAIVKWAEGENDGVVSVESARHGEHCEVWEGDHLHLINWPHPWAADKRADRLPDYARLIGRLADVGF